MNRKVHPWQCVLLLAMWVSCSFSSPSWGMNAGEQEKLSQIEAYYQAGKEDMQKGNYSSAIVNFNQVVELEKKFNVIYTPYAREFINTAKEKIREKENKEAVTVSSTTAVTGTKNSKEYVIGTEDVLFISIWQNRDLDQEVTVRPDGKIALLLIGEVQAQGLTISELDQVITDRMKEYIKYPEVSITIRKIGGKKVIILGEVKSPGVYTVSGTSTVLELLGLANGYTNDAVLSSVLVIRGGLQKPVGQKVDLARAMKKGDLSQNIVLEPEDIIYVPRSVIANVSYTMTQILSPIAQGLYTTQTIRNW